MALRVSELVSHSKTSKFGLQFTDVSISDEVVKIFIRHSKTDQLGKGRWVSLHAFSGSHICPIKLLASYLFIHIDSSPLTRFQFIGF